MDRDPIDGLTVRVTARIVLTLGMMTLAVCRPSDQRTDTMDTQALEAARTSLSDAARSALDLGGQAFREQDYDRALEHYRRAAEIEPDAAAPWFGIYMAERARGNAALADSALIRARRAAPGASLLLDSVP